MCPLNEIEPLQPASGYSSYRRYTGRDRIQNQSIPSAVLRARCFPVLPKAANFRFSEGSKSGKTVARSSYILGLFPYSVPARCVNIYSRDGHSIIVFSPQRRIASALCLCSHKTMQVRGCTLLEIKLWNDFGVHSNVSRLLLIGGTTFAGRSTGSFGPKYSPVTPPSPGAHGALPT